MGTTDGITYRVNVAFDTKHVTITSFGIGEVDKEVDGHYNSVNALLISMEDDNDTRSKS